MTGAQAAARAVIFDMDGVLIDSGAHHRDAWRLLLGDIGITPPPDYWRLTIGRPAEDAVPLLLGRRVDRTEAAALAQRKRDLYTQLAVRGTRAIPGVSAFVETLARQKVPRAVATSAGRREAESLLTEIGVRRCFDVVVTAEDVRWGKPNPEVYLKAAAGLAIPSKACLVFEDSLVGVHAARNCGMRVIGLTTSHTGRELLGAGAERAIADFEGFAWPV
ncbi:MAG: HAD family phosphatase [Candidatus Rokuibacteriota bacterium]|nr:MAG: HAD family phosphatase [Candidatus Rokubacteria bacterium]